ncbi:hypothetical protein, partial [uncultured Roseibium sp.]|uniref:hypothetical protein n=1 Tax=uncultured Roseibium sp. TaxID=1936171 RepID=UPI002617DAAB
RVAARDGLSGLPLSPIWHFNVPASWANNQEKERAARRRLVRVELNVHAPGKTSLQRTYELPHRRSICSPIYNPAAWEILAILQSWDWQRLAWSNPTFGQRYLANFHANIRLWQLGRRKSIR